MNQPRDAVVHHDLSQVLVVQDVGVNERAYKTGGRDTYFRCVERNPTLLFMCSPLIVHIVRIGKVNNMRHSISF